MEQIVDFQVSKEVYVRLGRRLIKAAKWHTLLCGYDIPQALCLRATEKFKSFILVQISYNNLDKYTLNHTQNWMLSFYKFSYFISRM
jgi:hypothetical protein